MPIYTIKLIDKKVVANNTIAFTFEKPSAFKFIAGQYGGFTLINPIEKDDKGATRRFSLLSAPDEPHLTIVTRIQTSAFKRNLNNLALGEAIKFAGPTGNFVLHEDGAPAVLIAGGIGIAPFYSIIKDVLTHKPAQQIILFYGNRSLADSAYLAEFQELEQAHATFKMIPVLSEPDAEWYGDTGFITDEILVKNLNDLDSYIYYVCGSPAMVAAMQQVLAELQISPDRIKVEDFPGY